MKMKLLTIAAMMIPVASNAAILPLDETQKSEISTNLVSHTLSEEAAKNIEESSFYNVLGKVESFKDLYAIEKDGEFIFSNKAGDVIIDGEVYDLKNEVSVTQQAKQLIAKPILASIAPDDVVVFESKLEETKGILYVFSDPTCHYCVKLHGEFDELNRQGFEIRVVPFVRSLEHRLSEDKTLKNIEIMGIADKVTQLAEYKKLINSKSVEVDKSNLTDDGFNKVKDGYVKGRKLGLRGTPMIMNAEGKSIEGYSDANRIIDTLF
ncbi:thioredoxin fold domain-containing protein [Vibrio sp. D431a]|uniref:thioredoxin fold domain-containing protein n=1 Tax=Vibrio sp. D431a TaxID=2837388 RepID=UPI00255741FA|nr:thioredoxin fold domain-containing protein [Vibrio sp. D431a]MDK9790595.1 thioredoxin fold domain-containing protein [Vibrio sp. D431a]